MEVLQRNQRYKFVQAIATCVACVIEYYAMEDDVTSLFCRNFMGEDLDSLSLKELQNLEHQLESALKHIRSRKVKPCNPECFGGVRSLKFELY